MRILTSSFFFSILLALSIPALGQSDETFYRLETRLANALKTGDREQLASLLTQDYSLTVAVAGGLVHVDRATWLENAVVNRELHDFQIHELVVRDYEGAAVVSSRYTGDATVNGVRQSTDYFLTDVWVMLEGKWLLSARYSSRPE